MQGVSPGYRAPGLRSSKTSQRGEDRLRWLPNVLVSPVSHFSFVAHARRLDTAGAPDLGLLHGAFGSGERRHEGGSSAKVGDVLTGSGRAVPRRHAGAFGSRAGVGHASNTHHAMRFVASCSRLFAIGIGLASAALGCESRPSQTAAAPPAGEASAALSRSPVSAEPTAAGAPRVVVSVIYDQLGSDTLLAHLDLLDENGAIRRAVERGVYLERSVYPYANTLTAPGHATIYTGTTPSRSGIDGNSAWDAGLHRLLPVTEDAHSPVFGRELGNPGASPTRLRVPTVAHALRAQTDGKAKILSLSVKDRSAILPVGSAANLVLWFDAKLGAFTSSPVWGPALPAWLAPYQAAHPLRALLVPWTAENPERYLARLGPDAAPGEGEPSGFGKVFPHPLDASAPLGALACTPMMSQYLVGLAETAAREMQVGQDSVVDLVALSVSGTDGAGHLFGPRSWEYVDHLIKADRAVGAWLSRLEQSTSLAVLITSDHGVAPLPESRGEGAGRIFPEKLASRVEAALSARFGAGPWVLGLHYPYVYLSERARLSPERVSILELARSALLEAPGVRDVWTLARVRSFGDGDPIERAFRLSVAPDNDADLMIYTQPYFPLDLRDPAGQGTNHGTPYDYDRQVPVLAYGATVPARRVSEPVDQLRVAATLSRLLGVAPPASAAPGPLF
jgi:arylsulfatase A-like enzyme